MSEKKQPKVNQRQLEIWLKKWKKILRLEDWDIKIAFARHYELPHDQGSESCATFESKVASIMILDPKDYDPELWWPQDAEASVVYRLIRVLFEEFFCSKASHKRLCQEQAISALSQGFMKVDRELSARPKDGPVNQHSVDRWLERWQSTLRLADWTVKVILRRADKIYQRAEGDCTITETRKMAVIGVLDPVDYRPGVWKKDAEDTVVHELIHLLFSPFMDRSGTSRSVSQEQAINSLAGSLVNLDRSRSVN